MKRRRWQSGIVLVALAAAGCLPWARKGDGKSPADDKATLTVENNNWAEMVVYLERGSTRSRLGSVGTGNRVTFAVPASMFIGSSTTLLADPIGSTTVYRSDPINMQPGQLLELRIENNLALSTLSIWN